jgi:hypothetical protein
MCLSVNSYKLVRILQRRRLASGSSSVLESQLPKTCIILIPNYLYKLRDTVMYEKGRKGILPMVWKMAFPLVFMRVS